LGVGGLNPTWTIAEVQSHLEGIYSELLASAQKAEKEPGVEVIYQKPKRDLAAEMDDIRVRLEKLEGLKIL